LAFNPTLELAYNSPHRYVPFLRESEGNEDWFPSQFIFPARGEPLYEYRDPKRSGCGEMLPAEVPAGREAR